MILKLTVIEFDGNRAIAISDDPSMLALGVVDHHGGLWRIKIDPLSGRPLLAWMGLMSDMTGAPTVAVEATVVPK